MSKRSRQAQQDSLSKEVLAELQEFAREEPELFAELHERMSPEAMLNDRDNLKFEKRYDGVMLSALVDQTSHGYVRGHRRTKDQLNALKRFVKTLLNNQTRRGSIRHLNYLLSSKYKLITKTEPAFAAMTSQLIKWRKEGEIPYGAFVDTSRFYLKATSYRSAMEDRKSTRLNSSH